VLLHLWTAMRKNKCGPEGKGRKLPEAAGCCLLGCTPRVFSHPKAHEGCQQNTGYRSQAGRTLAVTNTNFSKPPICHPSHRQYHPSCSHTQLCYSSAHDADSHRPQHTHVSCKRKISKMHVSNPAQIISQNTQHLNLLTIHHHTDDQLQASLHAAIAVRKPKRVKTNLLNGLPHHHSQRCASRTRHADTSN